MLQVLRLTCLVALAVLGLACGANPAGTLSSTPGATANEAVTSAPQETAVWNIYRSDRYRFEFQYPESCGVTEHDGALAVGGRIELVAMDAEGASLQDYVKKFVEERARSGGWTIESQTATAVNGREAITVDYRFGGTGRFGTATFIHDNGRIFVWSLTAGGFTCDEVDHYNQVRSSFRLVE